ncbi:efflux RND transporter periplasmic adaptor subunit [Phenylobacterium sp. LH3H17]|uniref:HlyD family secretion protein n=1 Tax=Phenylobacterium sp. LH3H17 TaxID=2903901 RepID=UPI0020C9D36D|nr:HlyD family efflux transporter periplasmic adaptor subunit [Phenylobacterium sp. LH3H17]UTP40721.1 efflux RND transporter periplasmic adaptor subunit [Phenylobacterium sp. LH3H17]
MFAFLKSHRIKLTSLLLLVVLGGGGFVYSSQAKAKQEAAAKVAAAKAPKSPYVAIANGKADVEGGIIQVAARRAGIVREVLVQEGDRVVKGQILARQEDDEPRLAAARAAAAVHQARAQISMLNVQLTSAQREHARLQGLVSTNFVAGQRMDQAADKIREAQANLEAQRAAVLTAQAALEEARYNQELTIIRAPADGRIARRYANPGAGASTLNVSNMFDLEPSAPRIVRAEIAESSLAHVSIGQAVQISPESDPKKVFSGQVMRRAAVFGARKLQSDDPSERTDDRVVEVVVSADSAPFLIGQRVLVKFMRPGATTLAAR